MTGQSTTAPKAPLRAGVYIVAVPIGNLGDITLRAIETLAGVAAIACEDSRVTGKLLSHLGIDTPMHRYDDHASDQQRERLIAMAHTAPIALASDAGTPLISDPGFKLIRQAREEGIPITTIPGPCAAIAGLTVSGFASDRFTFAGFLPVKEQARMRALEEFSAHNATLIFYETAPRLLKSLAAIAELWPDRQVAVARELTKLHEELRDGSAAQLIAHYTAHPPKGEIVLMIGPPGKAAMAADPDALLAEALESLAPSKAAAKVAKETGLDRQDLYKAALALKAGAS